MGKVRDFGARYFLLNDDHSVREVEMMEWALMFSREDRRRIAWTGNKHKFVSTVFLGLDHRFLSNGPPLLFETMAFVDGGEKWESGEPRYESIDCVRYSSWDDAETGHKAMVRKHLIDQRTRTGVANGQD